MPSLSSIWQKVAFLLAHKATFWLTLVLLSCSFAAWRLSLAFNPSPDKQKEQQFSRRVMLLHAGLAGFFWLTNWLIS